MYKSFLQLEFVDWQWSSDHCFYFIFLSDAKLHFSYRKKTFSPLSVAASTFSWRGNTEVL
jgi:hypothetical protein